jgi:ATP-binding cassette, subfamily B, bacterial
VSRDPATIDAATAGAAAPSLLALAGTFIAFALLDQVLVALGTFAGEDLGWRATNDLRADLIGHCLDLDPAFHDRHTPGELIERIDGDVTTLSSFFSTFVLYILWGFLLCLGVLVLLWREDWRVGLGLTVFFGPPRSAFTPQGAAVVRRDPAGQHPARPARGGR